MRPTGKLHLGHLVGALDNWVSLQHDYESFFFVADYHALTTNLVTSNIEDDSRDMVLDWLAAGIEPAHSPIFRQSQIKEHAELFLILSMLISTSRLERNPTLKEQVRDLAQGSISYGHLGYPVLQAADVLIYKADCVPVGEDQVPHLEFSRELARRFNAQYGSIFPEPEPKLTLFPRVPGLDRNKMSKSLNNGVLLNDEPETVKTKLRGAITDELKVRKNDPGRPEVCLIYTYHKIFNPAEAPEIEINCKSGALGCMECKQKCGAKINERLAPIIEKRKEIEAQPHLVGEILADGERRARAVAQATMEEVRYEMKMG